MKVKFLSPKNRNKFFQLNKLRIVELNVARFYLETNISFFFGCFFVCFFWWVGIIQVYPRNKKVMFAFLIC